MTRLNSRNSCNTPHLQQRDCECNWRCKHHAVQRLKYISSGASSCLVKIRKILRKICNQTGPQTVHTARQRHGEAGVPPAEIYLEAESMQDQTARRRLQQAGKGCSNQVLYKPCNTIYFPFEERTFRIPIITSGHTNITVMHSYKAERYLIS